MNRTTFQTLFLGLCGLAGAWLGTRSTLPDAGPEPVSAPVARPARPSFACDQDLDVKVHAVGHHGHWHFPGVRNLEPAIFGTVANPIGFDFGIGVPLYDRLDDGQGNWTTTALPTMDSNEAAHLGGEIVINARDVSPVDQPTYTGTTYDEITIRASITDPWGRLVTVRADTPLPKGPYYPFWGGVGTNAIVHGGTGLGSRTLPRTFAYLTAYAVGEVRINGQLLPGNDKRMVHVMVTHAVAGDFNNPGPAGGSGPYIGTNAEVDPNDLEIHLALPPTRFVPNPVANSPIAGIGDFLHIMFQDVHLEGSSIQGAIDR